MKSETLNMLTKAVQLIGGGGVIVAAVVYAITQFASLNAGISRLEEKTECIPKIEKNTDRIGQKLNNEIIPALNCLAEDNERRIKEVDLLTRILAEQEQLFEEVRINENRFDSLLFAIELLKLNPMYTRRIGELQPFCGIMGQDDLLHIYLSHGFFCVFGVGKDSSAAVIDAKEALLFRLKDQLIRLVTEFLDSSGNEITRSDVWEIGLVSTKIITEHSVVESVFSEEDEMVSVKLCLPEDEMPDVLGTELRAILGARVPNWKNLLKWIKIEFEKQ